MLIILSKVFVIVMTTPTMVANITWKTYLIFMTTVSYLKLLWKSS